MMGFKMQYLARTRKFKFLSKTNKIPKLKKKLSAKTLSRKRKLHECSSQTNKVDTKEGKLPESTFTHKEDGNGNTTEFSQYNGTNELEGNMPESAAASGRDEKESIIFSQDNGIDEKTEEPLEFVPSHEEIGNENMPRYVTEGKNESPKAWPSKKRRGEQFSDPSDCNIAEIKEDSEALPEFVVYDEITSRKSNAVGVMDSSEGLIDSWAIGDQDELAGIKRMCLPHAKLAPDTIVIPDDWRSAVEFISDNDRLKKSSRDCFAAPPIVVVCGAQNVGKTTFARFLLNNLLRRYKKVGYLDTDVGQPEFTPPGCLSLHIVEIPNPDLSILCLRTPERCHFYGDISPKSDPETYLHIIVSLYEHFRKEYYDVDITDESEASKRVQIPLVVNTHGWVKGLGYNVLVDMLRYMVPTHVVQIRLTAVSKNLPLGAFWSSVRDDESSTKLLYLGTAMKDTMNKSIVIQKHGRQMRELRITAYFRQCFGGSSESIRTYKELAHALASHPPYQVAIQSIKIVHLHCQVPDNEIYYSLNGTIVGLAVSSTTGPNPFSQPICVGLGIVRGIDIFKGFFHVITPVPLRTLQNVDTFLQGFIEVPMSILQAQGLTCPYMSSNAIAKEGTGSAIIQGGKRRDTKMDRIYVPQ